MTPDVVLAFDVGGTNLRVAAVDGAGAILARRTVPTDSRSGTDEAERRFGALAGDVLREAGGARPAAVGVGITGPVDPCTGIVDNPHTLPGWEHWDVRSALAARFDVPVAVDNDANAAALGEWWAARQAGDGARRLAVVTIGTGIGAGFVVDGVVQRSSSGRHGEAGHQILDPDGPRCSCGARGCWEVLAAGPAVTRQAAAHGLAETGGAAVARAAHDGDARALAVFAEIGRWIGRGLVNVIAISVPDTIRLSGSVGDELALLAPAIDQVLAEHGGMVPTDAVTVAPARAAGDAGLIGAARAAWDAAA